MQKVKESHPECEIQGNLGKTRISGREAVRLFVVLGTYFVKIMENPEENQYFGARSGPSSFGSGDTFFVEIMENP